MLCVTSPLPPFKGGIRLSLRHSGCIGIDATGRRVVEFESFMSLRSDTDAFIYG